MDAFKKTVKSYINYDKKIKHYNKELTKLRKARSERERSIINYMNKNDMKDTAIKISTGGSLEMCQSRRTAPMSKNYILNKLTVLYGSEKDAQKVVDYLYANRDVKYTDSLKHKSK